MSVVACACIETLLLLFRYRSGPIGWLVGNSNYSGMLVATGACFILKEANSKFAVVPKTVSIFLTFFLILGLLLSQSRSAMIGFLIGSTWIVPANRKIMFWSIVAMAMALLIYVNVDILKVASGSYATLFGRLTVWKVGLRAFQEKWLLGYGTCNFEIAYTRFQEPVGPILFYSLTTLFAHNDYLQIAVEKGIIGVLLAIGAAVRFVKNEDAGTEKNAEKAVLTLFAVSSLFNFNFYLPMTGMLAAGALGACVARAHAVPQTSVLRKTAMWLAFLLCAHSIFLILFATSQIAESKKRFDVACALAPFRSDLWYQRSLSVFFADSDSAMSFIKLSLRLNPNDPFIWSRYALFSAQTNPSEQSTISTAFSESLALAPRHAPFWLDRGFYFLSIGRNADAREDFRTAMRLEPYAAVPYYGLAAVCAKEDKKDQTSLLLREALRLKEKYATDASSSAYGEYLYGIDTAKIQAILSHSENKPVL